MELVWFAAWREIYLFRFHGLSLIHWAETLPISGIIMFIFVSFLVLATNSILISISLWLVEPTRFGLLLYPDIFWTNQIGKCRVVNKIWIVFILFWNMLVSAFPLLLTWLWIVITCEFLVEFVHSDLIKIS